MAAGDKFNGALVLSGEEVGTSSAVNVRCNFKPSVIQVNNVTSKSVYWWQPSHGEAGATKIVDSGVGTTDISTVTSNGITVSDGGFILGTGVQTTSDVVYWVAWR